jgi:cytochrome c-type biogenesis protein CcmH|tara:strand:- start:1771 stop:2151 length:381 start_codon:yes stop_codon:yes gene_type:complete
MKKILIIFFLNFVVNNFNFSYAEETKLQLEIYKNLRCLICQGQSIADSNSDFAQTVKLVVKDKIEEGKTKEEIYDFLISKYGEWIVYKPKLNKHNILLWSFPYFILIFGGIIIFILIKKRKNQRLN